MLNTPKTPDSYCEECSFLNKSKDQEIENSNMVSQISLDESVISQISKNQTNILR